MVSFFLLPTISFAESLPSSVSGTKERCIWGVVSSICTTAEMIVSGSCFCLMNSSASWKKTFISFMLFPWKNSGVAVITVSTSLTLSVLVRHPASRICRSASARYRPWGSTR